MPNQDFKNAKKLPPYIFGQINSLKNEARSRGEDIIDFGMGNPDQPTPNVVVNKLVETVKNPVTHRYSQSAGLPKLRLAIKNWYLRMYVGNRKYKITSLKTQNYKQAKEIAFDEYDRLNQTLQDKGNVFEKTNEEYLQDYLKYLDK